MMEILKRYESKEFLKKLNYDYIDAFFVNILLKDKALGKFIRSIL
jgi:hypothetical protein